MFIWSDLIGFHIKSVVPFSPDRRQGSNRTTEQENSEKKKATNAS